MINSDWCDVWVARLPADYGVDGKCACVKGIPAKRPSCRAFRLVGDTRRFLFLKVPSGINSGTLDNALRLLKDEGIFLVVPKYVLLVSLMVISDVLTDFPADRRC